MQRLWKVCAIILPLIFPASASAEELKDLQEIWNKFSDETGIGFSSHSFYTGPRSRPISVPIITFDMSKKHQDANDEFDLCQYRSAKEGFSLAPPLKRGAVEVKRGSKWGREFFREFDYYRESIE